MNDLSSVIDLTPSAARQAFFPPVRDVHLPLLLRARLLPTATPSADAEGDACCDPADFAPRWWRATDAKEE